MARRKLLGLTLAGLTIVLGWLNSIATVSAHTPHPGLDFSIAIAGAPGCDTTQGDKSCSLLTGTPFTLDVNLGPLPNDIPDYSGFEADIFYSGLQPQGEPNPNVWPDCGIPLGGLGPGADEIGFGCAIGLSPAQQSTFSGLMATIPFSCNQSGTIVLRNGEGYTEISDARDQTHAGPPPDDTLTVNCTSGPGAVTPLPDAGTTPGAPTSTPLPPTEAAKATATAKVAATATAKAAATAATKTPTGTGGSSSGGGGGIPGWAIALIIVGAVVGVGGGGYAGWRYRQSRTPAGGGTT